MDEIERAFRAGFDAGYDRGQHDNNAISDPTDPDTPSHAEEAWEKYRRQAAL